jgi:hypothetical protein
MTALEVGGELTASERPTIPVPEPRESGVRLQVAQLPIAAATVDVVVCDLTRDPRSESYMPRPLAKCAVLLDQNESPPSTSTVRALK